MNHIEVGRFWNENAEAWTKLSRAGYDIYRDYLKMPPPPGRPGRALFPAYPRAKGASQGS
jgi:hypothetical protein